MPRHRSLTADANCSRQQTTFVQQQTSKNSTMKYLYIIVIALAFASCKSNSNAPQKSSQNHTDSLAQVITTTTVKERPMNDELLLNGNISCDESLMRERSASEYRSSLERIDKEVERVIRIMK